MARHRLSLSRSAGALGLARLLGASGLAVVAQVAVDMPEGYFGPADHMTRTGLGYSAAVALGLVLLYLGLRRRAPWTDPLVAALLATHVGLFIAPMTSDPLMAGLVVVWSLTSLAQHFLPSLRTAIRRPVVESELDRWLERRGPAVRHLALVSLLLTVAVVGYRLGDHPLPLAVCALLSWGNALLCWPLLRPLLAARSRMAWAITALYGVSLLLAFQPAALLALLAAAQGLLLALVVYRDEGAGELLAGFLDHPSRLILASFASVILVGTVLLTFPAASTGAPLSPLDALFTATSATCVTGLIVVDTPHDLSPMGQGIVLALIQVGGLGIMVLSTYATLLLGGTLGLRGERALKEVLELAADRTAYRLTRFIVVGTLAIEAVGALALAAAFLVHGRSPGEALWSGIFHSISAFCNAGFALQSDSVVLFQENPFALGVLMVLITAGGLGFVVLASLWWRLAEGRRRGVLDTQARTVLVVSIALVLLGWLAYGLLEWDRTLAGLDAGDRVVNALFQSITLRTAGFNSVPFDQLAPATLLVMTAFMFIGASPGSTGGGIKTTTVAVLLAAILALVRSSKRVVLMRREIHQETVYRSLAIAVTSALGVGLSLLLLLIFEAQPFEVLAFEAVSAVATVGLSVGATAALGPVGKLVIIVTMFMGRIGPLTLALVLGTGRPRRERHRYPTGKIMVG